MKGRLYPITTFLLKLHVLHAGGHALRSSHSDLMLTRCRPCAQKTAEAKHGQRPLDALDARELQHLHAAVLIDREEQHLHFQARLTL